MTITRIAFSTSQCIPIGDRIGDKAPTAIDSFFNPFEFVYGPASQTEDDPEVVSVMTLPASPAKSIARNCETKG